MGEIVLVEDVWIMPYVPRLEDTCASNTDASNANSAYTNSSYAYTADL
jgi:hypothetical protein